MHRSLGFGLKCCRGLASAPPGELFLQDSLPGFTVGTSSTAIMMASHTGSIFCIMIFLLCTWLGGRLVSYNAGTAAWC